ncbi:MAG: hypothetical protein RL120_00230 [Gammaproteobacteria bacterium]
MNNTTKAGIATNNYSRIRTSPSESEPLTLWTSTGGGERQESTR